MYISSTQVKKFRVVSFQSEAVVSQLLSNGIHLADKELLREGSLCQEDINACSGNIPIWVFQHPCFRTTKVGYRQWCVLLETFRCEMSVDSLSGMYMIELLLDSQPTIGKAHNGTSIACVIDAIRLENVAAIYKIDKTKHWYFYEVTPVRIFAEDVLFKDCVSFNRKEYSEDDTVIVKLSDFRSAEDYYKDGDEILEILTELESTDNIRSEMEEYANNTGTSYENLCNLIYNSMPTLLRKEDKIESVESYWNKWKDIQDMLK